MAIPNKEGNYRTFPNPKNIEERGIEAGDFVMVSTYDNEDLVGRVVGVKDNLSTR